MKYRLIERCFIYGLDLYEKIVHSIATRDVIVHPWRGLSKLRTSFRNLVAILSDVVICYNGIIGNVWSNFIIQFAYGVGIKTEQLFPNEGPISVLNTTIKSNIVYEVVLDSSHNSNFSWDLMKEILPCKVNFRIELIDYYVILYSMIVVVGRVTVK